MSNVLSLADHRGTGYVYLIEDDEDLRIQLSNTLEDAGLHVLQFANAEALLANGLCHEPAVVVSDMTLPGLSGLELFKAIRSAGFLTPLIFISGYSEPNQIIEAMKLGAADFLWKPFKTETLVKLVNHSLFVDMQRNEADAHLSQIGLLWDELSKREQEVCKLMLGGYGNKDVSLRLDIQPDTANKHRIKVLKKMGVAGRPQLIDLLKDFEPAKS